MIRGPPRPRPTEPQLLRPGHAEGHGATVDGPSSRFASPSRCELDSESELSSTRTTTVAPSLRLRDSRDCFSPGPNAGGSRFAASFCCPRSFDRAVMVAQWYDLRLKTRETRVRTLGKQWSRHYPSNTNLRYQEVLDWRKLTEGECSFLLSSAQI